MTVSLLSSTPHTQSHSYSASRRQARPYGLSSALRFGWARRISEDRLGLNQETDKLSDDQKVLRYFLDLVKIPSPSGQEAAVRDYITGKLGHWGIDRNQALDASAVSGLNPSKLYFKVDDAGNVIVVSPGVLPRHLKGQKEQLPAWLVYSGHMDTVDPTGPITPILRQYKNGDVKIEAPKDYVLGADDKAALAPMLARLEKLAKQAGENPNQPRPTEVYIFTTGEEAGVVGARQLDKSWIRPANGVWVFDAAEDDITASLRNQAPGVDRRFITLTPNRFQYPIAPSSTDLPKRTFILEVRGVAAHASTVEQGRNAASTLLSGLGHFLDDSGVHVEGLSPNAPAAAPKVRVSVQQLEAGIPGKDRMYYQVNTVASSAKALISLSGAPGDMDRAEEMLGYALQEASQKEDTRVSMSETPEQTPVSLGAQAVNALTALTFRELRQGRQANGASLNLGTIEPLSQGGLRLGFDLRGQDKPIEALVDYLAGKRPENLERFGIQWQNVSDVSMTPYYTDPDHPFIRLSQSVLRDTAQAFATKARKPLALPRVKAAIGSSDLAEYCSEPSERYPGQKVPGAELACYHRHHQPGGPKEADTPSGFDYRSGEYALASELRKIGKMMEILSDAHRDPGRLTPA